MYDSNSFKTTVYFQTKFFQNLRSFRLSLKQSKSGMTCRYTVSVIQPFKFHISAILIVQMGV